MEKHSSEDLNITLVSKATQVIKAAIVQSQARSVQLVNQEMLALYFGIGRYVSINSRKGGWGTGVIDSISRQLKAEMPGLKGFSASMLKRMRTFYEEWESIEGNSVMPITEITNINNSTNSVIQNTELEDERVIETKIVMNIKNFIMTFGRSFTYMGNQVHYDKLGHDHWVDLLFFNRELKCLVVIELKKGAFKTSYLGQLSTYLRILDDDEKLPGENPSVGLVLCKSADKAYVEYVIQDYPHPMGVATYQTKDDIQSRLDSVLPPKEEMVKLLEGKINGKEDEV